MGKGGEKSIVGCEKSEKSEVLIEGRMYDVTNLKHPGGSVLNYYVGKEIDATQAFNQFHFRSKTARKFLESLPSRDADAKKISEHALPGQLDLLADFEALTLEFEKEGFFKPNIPHVVFRVTEILAFYTVGFWLLLHGQVILGTIILGLGQARCGWFMHEAGHYSFTGRFLCYCQLFFVCGTSKLDPHIYG